MTTILVAMATLGEDGGEGGAKAPEAPMVRRPWSEPKLGNGAKWRKEKRKKESEKERKGRFFNGGFILREVNGVFL